MAVIACVGSNVELGPAGEWAHRLGSAISEIVWG